MSIDREAFEAWQRFGSKAEAARQLKVPITTLKSRIDRYQQDPAITDAQNAVGTTMRPQLIWAKTKGEDGTSYSVLLKPAETQEDPEDVLDRIADRMNRIKPAPSIKRPKACSSSLRNFLPLFDVHLSMRVGSYGTAEAVQRLQDGSTDILERLPPSECTIIVNGGDFTEQNDPSNLTPQSKHPLPVDAEYDDTTDVATDVTVEIIDKALNVSDHVIYKALRGNHDPNTARILRAALRQRYRNNPRVTIEDKGIEFYVNVFGKNFLAVHHGDAKGKAPKDYVMTFAARHPVEWGQTIYRELHTGHLHHVRMLDFPGMLTHQHRAVCPKGRHSEEQLWEAVSEMTGICYRDTGGRHDSVTHYFG